MARRPRRARPKAHGEPLGDEEIAKTKAVLRLAGGRQVPACRPRCPSIFKKRSASAARSSIANGSTLFADYEKKYPELAAELKLIQNRQTCRRLGQRLADVPGRRQGHGQPRLRRQSAECLAKNMPWLLGGSADLAPSTKTLLTFDEAGGDLEANNPGGRNMHFGIREHGMVAAVNGMVLCGLRAFGATFFVFSDYCRPSIRLAAIMKIPTIIVFTHDSIGVGEDGPTHEPVEHLAACRAIPRLIVLRPADANETAASLARGDSKQTDRPSR